MWVTAFLDLGEDLLLDDAQRAEAFWLAVTGCTLSARRGATHAFATLIPPDGDPFLRVQRLGTGPSRVHLDLHVADIVGAVRAATALGARLVAHSDHAVMASPGGFAFCFVGDRLSVRPRPPAWPGGHTSLVDQVCLDIPPSLHTAECAFWEALTGWHLQGAADDELRALDRPADQPIRLLLQRLHDEQPAVTGHVDIATSDRPAEVARHVALGAQVRDVRAGWTVMSPPAGQDYCITDRDPGSAPAG